MKRRKERYTQKFFVFQLQSRLQTSFVRWHALTVRHTKVKRLLRLLQTRYNAFVIQKWRNFAVFNGMRHHREKIAQDKKWKKIKGYSLTAWYKLAARMRTLTAKDK